MRRILIVRRDSIGDLVCSTPIFEATNVRYQNPSIHAVANSYSAAALDGNPHVSKINFYENLKDRLNFLSVPMVIVRRIRPLLKLCHMKFDDTIVVGNGRQLRVVNYLWWIRPVYGIGHVSTMNVFKVLEKLLACFKRENLLMHPTPFDLPQAKYL